MPIENITSSQRQHMLSMQPLSEQLNKKNKIYNLRNVIDWVKLEDEILALLNAKRIGRCRRSVRVMLGVLMLQAMQNGSDCYASEELQENIYWQYFWVCVSGRGNFILAVKSFHGNPYDGHTLAQTVSVAEKTMDQEIGNIFVDLGYRGNNYSKKSKIYMPCTKKEITPKIRKMTKRRSAIEPIIGHLKNYGRMGRNHLKGIIGDILNPMISAIGLNLRLLAKKAAASSA